jgi:homoprotocatechuate degradation regulator HpaR
MDLFWRLLMTGEFDHRNLAMLLLQARESVMGAFRPVLKQFSLTEQQWRIIRALNDHPANEMEAGQIARECCILSPSLTGMLERMERDDLIRRSRPAADQRKVVVSLTAQSKMLVKRISPLIDAQYQDLERKVGTQTLGAAYKLLDQLIAIVPRDEALAAPAALDPQSNAR